MKHFKTSYLANVSKLPEYCVPIFIAYKWPREELFTWYRKLAPSGKLLGAYRSGEIDNSGYVNIFKKYLETLDYKIVRKELTNLCGSKVPVLICYETPEKFCHRHLVAQWIREHGDECQEFSVVSDFFE